MDERLCCTGYRASDRQRLRIVYCNDMSSPARHLPSSARLRAFLGDIDIYLFDQIAKGRFDARRTVLDAGCGSGRNLVFFLQQGFEVFGVDQNAAAIARVRDLAAQLAPDLPPDNFHACSVDSLPLESESVDAVVSSAVLHFASDEEHFASMLEEMWRVLRPQGLLFARLASNIGLEDRVVAYGRGRFRLPDGSDRFLVTEADLLGWTDRLHGTLLEPIKTTNVQNLRCMTTWCVEKQ